MSNTRLQALRKERRMSTRDLAENISISYSAISKVERGEQELRVNDIIEICNLFKCSSDYLIYLSDKRNPDKENALIFNDNEKAVIEAMQEITDEGKTLLMDYIEFLKQKYPAKIEKILYNGQQLNFVRGVKDEK